MGRYTTLATILCSIAPLLAQPLPLPFAPFLPNELIPVSCPPRTSDDAPGEADFLILGAGLAGLGAAHYLHAHTTGCIIRVLEARDVPGGRVRTLPEGPFAGMEVGAGWIHEYKGNPMLSVADANGLYTKVLHRVALYCWRSLIRSSVGRRKQQLCRRRPHPNL
jgi:monoamine oxidase